VINLSLQLHYFFPEGDGVFQDDSARIHRAPIVNNWFQEHDDSVEHLNWPPQSPDLNPIENMWAVIDKSLRSNSNLPSSLVDLAEKLMLLWPKIRVQKLHDLVQSMPKRMQAVIRAKSGPTKY